MKHRKFYLFIMCFLTFPIIMTVTAYANPDVKPFIIIVVDNAPSDLEITFGERAEKGRKYVIGMETQFAYHSGMMPRESGYKINVTANGQTSEYRIDTPLEYRNIYTVNLNNQEIVNGKTPLRYIRQVMIYVLLTLLLEGFIFYIFGFRKKKSWIFFVIINLISQGLLHIWIDSPNLFDSYMDTVMIFGIDELIFALILGELIVFLFEIFAFMIAVREKGIVRRIICALVANSFSLLLGLLMFPYIPI